MTMSVEVPHSRYYPVLSPSPALSELSLSHSSTGSLYIHYPIHLILIMFAARSIRPAASVARTQVAQQQSAGMATLKELDQRLKSVRNIEKITKVSCDSSSAVNSMGRLDRTGLEMDIWI